MGRLLGKYLLRTASGKSRETTGRYPRPSHIVRHRLVDVAHINLLEVHRLRLRPSVEHCHSRLAGHIVLLLIRIRMPVQFPRPTWFQPHNSSGNAGCRPYLLIDNLHLAALGHLMGIISHGLKSKGRQHRSRARFSLLFSFSRPRGNSVAKMYSSFFGTLSNVSGGTSKFFANTSFGVCAIQSVRRNFRTR
jgi:hypothetical protein